MRRPANDNAPAVAGHRVPIIGYVGQDGRVTITDPSWRPSPAPGDPPPFPNDPRQA